MIIDRTVLTQINHDTFELGLAFAANQDRMIDVNASGVCFERIQITRASLRNIVADGTVMLLTPTGGA